MMIEKLVILGIFMLSTLSLSFLIRVLKVSTDNQHKKFLGVCAGLSKVSDMPLWMIRGFFITFALILGYGIIFYFSLWLFMPKES